jgi:hypothetical protein
MSDWEIRARGALTKNFALVVGCMLVLAAAGGWVTYSTHVDPGTHVEERPGAWWETTAEFGHAATVTEPNPVYPVGTTLTDRSAYYGAIAPRLDGNFTYGYAASEGGSLTLAVDADVVLQAVERNQSGAVETRYWRQTRDLGESEARGVAPGESVRVPFSFNASELARETDRIDEELGASLGETEALVRTTVTLTGTVNGESVDRTERYALPVGLGNAYTVEDPGPTAERHAPTRTVTVPNRYGPVRRLGGPVLLGVGLGGAVGLVWARRRGRLAPPTSAETERLSFREARSEFDEWIHAIDLPASAFERPRAEAESLADLVDFAIDTNSSVVEDAEAGQYYVLHDGYLYTYAPPALDQSGDDVGDGVDDVAAGVSDATDHDGDGDDDCVSDETGEADGQRSP